MGVEFYLLDLHEHAVIGVENLTPFNLILFIYKRNKDSREYKLSVSGLGKAHSVVAQVELSVVWTNEHVSQDPDGAHGRGDVHPHEAGEADLFPHLGDLHDVVIRLQGEIHTADGESDVRETGERGAVCIINIDNNLIICPSVIPMMYSPPTTGVPPSALLMALTSSTGPAIREVPVSAMAWHPPLQKLD